MVEAERVARNLNLFKLERPMVQRAAFKQSKRVMLMLVARRRTSAFPKLRPCSMPMKAPGAFSRPSVISSR
jgi:hypothetical protein